MKAPQTSDKMIGPNESIYMSVDRSLLPPSCEMAKVLTLTLTGVLFLQGYIMVELIALLMSSSNQKIQMTDSPPL